MKTKLGLHRLFLTLLSLSGIIAAAPPAVAATTIFNNTAGLFNGYANVTTSHWLAGRFCVGPQPYTLDSAALLLNSQDVSRPHVGAVRLQIYSQNQQPACRQHGADAEPLRLDQPHHR